MSRLGKYTTQRISGESYKAYVPAPLPLNPPLQIDLFSNLLEKSIAAVSELNVLSQNIPNTSLFLYMYVRKEALLSSQIEGIQSSLSDLVLFESNQPTEIDHSDVEEVSNYVKAINYAIERLNNGFPLSLRLLKETHGILLSGGRGVKKMTGELRKSQNWIGGTRPGNALFVPPPVENLQHCLSNLESFFYYQNLPVLLKAGISHVQFETIHPFLDGNGRLGRLLIILLLIEGGLIDSPILYISLYLKENRTTYYNLLQEARVYGKWESWIEFFLTAVYESSKQAIESLKEINKLLEGDKCKLLSLGRARASCERILEYMKQTPKVSVPFISSKLQISAPTARHALNHMVKLGIVEEVTGKQRDKVYVYRKYLDVLEIGTEAI